MKKSLFKNKMEMKKALKVSAIALVGAVAVSVGGCTMAMKPVGDPNSETEFDLDVDESEELSIVETIRPYIIGGYTAVRLKRQEDDGVLTDLYLADKHMGSEG